MKSKLFATIKLLNKTERRAYEILTISLFAISFLGIFALRPSVKVVAAYQKKLNAAKTAERSLTEKINSLKIAEANLKKCNSEVGKVKIALPDKFNQSDILKQLSFIAAKNKTTMLKTEFELEENKEPADIKSVKISITARGDYKNIYEFIKNLETEQRYIKINSVIIQAEESLSNAKIEVLIFYLNYAKR